MTAAPRPDEAALDTARAFTESLGSAQKVFHDHARRFGLYADSDAVERAAPTALAFTASTRLMHVVSELAEAFEEIRNLGDDLDHGPRDADHPLASELADAMLHLMDLAADLGIDLGAAIAIKLSQAAVYARRPHRLV